MRTPIVAAVALVLIIGGTGPVVAQMNDRVIPATFVTGTVTEDTATEIQGRVSWEQTVAWSDPRLPSTLRAEAAWYIYGDTPVVEPDPSEVIEDRLVMVTEIRVSLDGPDGSWRGSGRALEQGSGTDPDRHYSYYVLLGDGAYDGMHALLRGAPGHDAHGPWDEEYEGWIIESELPPRPAWPSASP